MTKYESAEQGFYWSIGCLMGGMFLCGATFVGMLWFFFR
jgi:hypothetical protein